MMAVVIYLVDNCRNNDNIHLGVSHRLKNESNCMVSEVKFELPCRFDPDWVKAYLKVGEAYGGSDGLSMAMKMRIATRECRRDCSNSGSSEVSEEDLSLRLEDGDPKFSSEVSEEDLSLRLEDGDPKFSLATRNGCKLS